MANPHSTVKYVEPNSVFDELTKAANDGNTYDRAPNLEDYCIYLDIEVELSSRDDAIRKNGRENNVIIMSYKYGGSEGQKDRVNFMSGSKIIDGESPNFLTAKYADMYITDLVDYGTTEMLGIKSVDIQYDSSFVPVITIVFTDVRGMSLFQPTELNNNKSYNGIRGFTKDNIAQSFFHAFFTLPLPKFTIHIKGFYGRMVSYEVMCEKFDAAFNSTTGDFDVTARFIGFAYSFMSDVSLPALLAAPYSDYVGEQYWKDNIANKRFEIPSKDGQTLVPMPTLYEIRAFFKTLLNTSDRDLQLSTLTSEDMSHDVEIGNLSKLRNEIRDWYKKLYALASKKYGADFVFLFGDKYDSDNESDKDYTRLIILTNGENISGDNLSGEYLQYDEDFKKINNDLYNSIEKYNETSEAYRKLDNVSTDFSKYSKVKVFNELWYNSKTSKITFDGFHKNNILPREETLNIIFNENDRDRRLSRIYNDGTHQYIDAFVIEQDYSDIKRRINALIEDANKSYDEKEREERLKDHNRYMFRKMKWYPSIENVTKIIMAHFETLMAIMFKVVEETKNRTPEQMQVTIGEDGDCPDVNSSSKILPPFPRITKLRTNSDGISTREDAWIGDFNRGAGFREVDFVNGLLNGISKIKEIENAIKAIENEQNSEQQEDEIDKSKIQYPLSPFDFFLANPYGTNSLVISNKDEFVGRICIRMFDILSLNHFRREHKNSWVSEEMISNIAKVEAENFHKYITITNVKLMEELGENGSIGNADAIISIVTDNGVHPWNTDGNASALFNASNGFWLERYSTNGSKKIFLYPLDNMSFERAESALKVLNEGKCDLSNNDNAITSIQDYGACFPKALRNKETKLFHTAYIGRYTNMIQTALNDGAANDVAEEYKPIAEMLLKSVEIEKKSYSELFNTTDGFVSSFNAKQSIPTYSNEAKRLGVGKHLYVGDSEDDGKCTSSAHDLDGYFTNDITGDSVNGGILTESFGFKKVKHAVKFASGTKVIEIYEIDKDKSLFMINDFYKLTGWEAHTYNFTKKDVQMAFFIMGLDCFSYNGKNLSTTKTFCNIPRLMALQIGVVLAAHASASGINAQFNNWSFAKIREKVHVSKTFENKMTTFLNTLSPFGRMEFIKYFILWSASWYHKIMESFIIKKETSSKTAVYAAGTPGVVQEVTSTKILYKNNINSAYARYYNDGNINMPTVERALFKQDSNIVVELTNNLMLPVVFIRSTICSITDSNGRILTRNDFKLDVSQVKTYLNSFLARLRELKHMSQNEENNPTLLARDASQTNNDIKIEMYRYLKQLFDKWVPTTKFEDWKFETFFKETSDEENKDKTNSSSTDYTPRSDGGHLFHFIDSYYNKIGRKLLINPQKLSESVNISTQYVDVNVMMYTFLADLYGGHRCMMKCVQNFRDLSKGMDDMFKPLSFNKMGRPRRFADFVVVYTYAPSRNLNVPNGEFNDDGFMLNDELETPLPIKSRGGSEDESSEGGTYYKIPAFGVAYGKQYQSYFKNVNVNMSQPVMTQQAILAKHSILASSRNDKSKNVTAQDLYDIYTNQSYTCTVEMLGCAWVQPLMYFVLLNIPMFRGSYLIMKVTHKITPGNMTTTLTGCRMANVSNRMVEDIFTDEDNENNNQRYSSGVSSKSKSADLDNDCPYEVFPIAEDSNASSVEKLDGTRTQKAHQIMRRLMSSDYGYTKEAAAGIVGNIGVETGEKFDPSIMGQNGGKDTNGYFVGGLCQWNDKDGNLTKLLTKNFKRYGQPIDSKGTIDRSMSKLGVTKLKEMLSRDEFGVEYQLTFLDKTIGQVTVNGKTQTLYSKSKLNSCTTPKEAAISFLRAYERGSNETERANKAEEYYNSYGTSDPPPSKSETTHDTKSFADLFFNAVQKSAWSSPSSSIKLTRKIDGDTIFIQQENKGTDKLANVFDIILNGYYDHVQFLYWICSNSWSENAPMQIVVNVAEKVNIAKRDIAIGIYKQQGSADSPFTKENTEKGQISGSFLKSIAKKYSDPPNNNILVKEAKQFRNLTTEEKEKMFKDYMPKDCNEIYGGNSQDVATSSGVSPKLDGAGNLRIKDWNISASIRWLFTHAINNPPPYGNGKCATYVEDAIHAGGLPRMKCGGSGAATNLHYRGILKDNGFNLEYSGTCTKNNRNTSFSVQPGDVCIIGWDVDNGEPGAYHVCMYTNKGWWSDFNQKDKMTPYPDDWSKKNNTWNYPKSKDYKLPYYIYRYVGK